MKRYEVKRGRQMIICRKKWRAETLPANSLLATILCSNVVVAGVPSDMAFTDAQVIVNPHTMSGHIGLVRALAEEGWWVLSDGRQMFIVPKDDVTVSDVPDAPEKKEEKKAPVEKKEEKPAEDK